jgi:hypothetical protein
MSVLIDARTALFGALIDHAGLLPPEPVDMPTAVAEYRDARDARTGWIAGRFQCQASELEDLAAQLTRTMTPGEGRWEINVVFDGDPGAAASAVAAFDAEIDPAASIVLAQSRLPAGAGRTEITDIFTAAAAVKPSIAAFLEIPPDGDWERDIPATVDLIDAVRKEAMRTGGAMFRCGGPNPEDYPITGKVAAFIVACHSRGLPFMFAEGLDHAIRHHDPDLGFMRHGFLNLVTASSLAAQGEGELAVLEAVDETDPTTFVVSAAGMRWRDHSIGTRAIVAARSAGMVGFGSRSFTEPVAELDRMRLLPPGGGR